MKSILLSLVFALSFQVHAEQSQYVACATPELDVSYMTLFEVNSGRVMSYARFAFDYEIEYGNEISREEYEMGDFYIEVANYNDTSYGYKIFLNKDILNNWEVKNWTAGHASGNYGRAENNDQVVCHLLKTKPKTSTIDSKNIIRTL